MKYLCLLSVAIVAIACNFQVSDTRSPTERAATQTARAMLIPPLPHTIRVRIVPPPTASLLPTVTPTKGTP